MRNKFNAGEFDEDFYRCLTGTKGKHRRDINHGVYQHFANRLKEAFDVAVCKTILDVGAGLGIRTTNHINNGFDAYPCDVSQYGYDNSLLPDKHIKCDVRELSSIGKVFDIVIAERVLGYIPPEDSHKALCEIDKTAKDYIVLSIICSDHRDPNIPVIAMPCRKNIQPKSFWEALFAKLNWELDIAKTAKMLKDDWDCIWVFKKLGVLISVNHLIEVVLCG